MAPTIGGAVGGGIGAIGGPATAVAGAGLGAATGQVIKNEAAVVKQAEKFEALSEGDVSKLLELRLQDERGWFQELIDGIYDILIISAIAMTLIYLAQFIYTRKLQHKK